MPTGGFPYTTDYDRLIELYDTDGTTLLETLNSISGGQKEVADASFEWLRLGGCGAGSMTLNRGFDASRLVCGQWVKMSYKADEPWYFGRIESWDATCPVGVTVSLYGPMAVLTEVQAGGQGTWDTRVPHTYAKGDYFVNDPDHSVQSFDSVNDHDGLIRLMFDQYIGTYSGGLFTLGDVIVPGVELDFSSVTFRGEESISQILRGLSDACYGASYGINANREFFFIPKNEDVQAEYVEGADLQSLKCSEDRSLMYNRMILVGGYVYGANSHAGFYRWVSTHFDTASMDEFGAKQVRIYLPWVRTASEATNFATGFFEKYAGPTTRYSVTTMKQGEPLLPWAGTVTLTARAGATWDGDASTTAIVDQVNVSFNEAPQFEFTTGPEELQYPLEPEAQRWELGGGGDVDNISERYSLNYSFSFVGTGDSGSDGPYYTGDDGSARSDEFMGSDLASDYPSQGDSNFPTENQSNYPSSNASNYPTDGTNMGCDTVVCDVVQDGCTITVTKMTIAELAAAIAMEMQTSPILAANVAEAIEGYLWNP